MNLLPLIALTAAASAAAAAEPHWQPYYTCDAGTPEADTWLYDAASLEWDHTDVSVRITWVSSSALASPGVSEADMAAPRQVIVHCKHKTPHDTTGNDEVRALEDTVCGS